MANEAILVERFNDPISMPCGDVGYEKGSFVELTDNRIVSGSVLRESRPCGGIVAREKIAGDGRNHVAVFQDGIFNVLVSGSAIGIGVPCMMAENNYVMLSDAVIGSGAAIIGQSLEAGSDDARMHMKLMLR